MNCRIYMEAGRQCGKIGFASTQDRPVHKISWRHMAVAGILAAAPIKPGCAEGPIPKTVLLLLKGPAVGIDWAGEGAKPPPKAGAGGTAAGFDPNAPTICMHLAITSGSSCKECTRDAGGFGHTAERGKRLNVLALGKTLSFKGTMAAYCCVHDRPGQKGWLAGMGSAAP